MTVNVGNVDEPGTVSFDAGPPRADTQLTARLSDPDGGVSGVTWAWHASTDGTNWAAIDGAAGASYTPSADDAGRYLRATASYADGHSSGKSAVAATASRVEAAPEQQQRAANNEPQFSAENTTRSVDENAAAGTNAGAAVTATDADGDTLTYAISGSNAFVIDGSSGQISVAPGAALDHETQSSYPLTVTVSDSKDAEGNADDGVDDSIAVAVSVGNVDEAGTVSFDPDPPQVGRLLTASLNDPDGGVSRETWTWERSADGTTWTDIDGASGASYTPVGEDAGSFLRATAGYADGHGPGKSAVAATASKVEAAPKPPAEPEPPTITAGPVITSSPASGDSYGEGEVITVALTFSEAVTVTGEPRVRLEVGERKRWARYSGAVGATLTFAYKVKKVDADDNGVSIGADRLQLNGGSIQDGDGNAAVLSHPALPAQAGHKVDGSQAAPADGQQQPPANSQSSMRTLRRPSIRTRTRRWARARETRLPPSTATAACWPTAWN